MNIIKQLDAEIARQRAERGDLLTLGSPDEVIVAARAEIVRLQSTVLICRDAFREYERHHRDKGTTESLYKAERNARLADMCDAVAPKE